MATDINDFYKKPLNNIYDEWPQSTRDELDKDIKKIWYYFILWCVFVLLSIAFVYYLVTSNLIDEPIAKKLQRVGSVISLLVLFGEVTFLYKLNKLAKVIYPVTLLFEVYKARRFKPLMYFTAFISIFFITLGTIVSSYGDLVYNFLELASV
ncbi:hypothetical protein MTF64_12705 [Pseudoalteromonas sp. 2CM41L]|uniref:hypothetical protein n=1 Tax=Pseudoalteromonas sp. 2CM41L TaxID=2929857 RepID=UPI0020BD6A2C|nr:hypothetical protein [Pseudoalteromonas sp. 2CM41L]MCK8107737.1 hypothetical protein [Pseudoalteromonas sp. 2CM41L]